MDKNISTVLIISSMVFILGGCSAHKHSEQHVSSESRQERVEQESNDRGVIGGVVGFVGDVVALPFRLVGGVIDFIF